MKFFLIQVSRWKEFQIATILDTGSPSNLTDNTGIGRTNFNFRALLFSQNIIKKPDTIQPNGQRAEPGRPKALSKASNLPRDGSRILTIVAPIVASIKKLKIQRQLVCHRYK